MEELNEVLDEKQSNNENKTVPEGVKVLAILSIVGSSLWSVLILIAMLYLMLFADALDRLLPGSGNGSLVAIIAIICLLMIGLNVAGIIAAVKMRQGKKKMFVLYAIVTGIWALLMLGGYANPNEGNILNLFSALASIGFIIGFGVQMKNMPD